MTRAVSDSVDQQVNLEEAELQDPRVLLESLELVVSRAVKVLRVQLVRPGRLDQVVKMDRLVHKEPLVRRELSESLVQLEPLVRLEIQE